MQTGRGDLSEWIDRLACEKADEYAAKGWWVHLADLGAGQTVSVSVAIHALHNLFEQLNRL